MDLLIFKMLRGAAIVFYLLGALAGGLMLFGLFGATFQVSQGGLIAPESLILALAWAVIPVALGFALDRLALIGTKQRA